MRETSLTTRLLVLALLLTAGASAAAAPRSPGERPLPAFAGYTLDAQHVSISDYIGKRLLLFFFNPEVPEALPTAKALRGVARDRGSHNFAVVGVVVGSSRPRAVDFRDDLAIDFPIIDDSDAAITRRLGLQSPVTLIAADAEGYMTFGMTNFDVSRENASEAIEDRIREALRLPERQPSAGLPFGARPRAPSFEAVRLAGGEPFDAKVLAGKPSVVIFFLHTCPHCHEALAVLQTELGKIPAAKRPALIGVSVLDRPAAVRQMLAEKELQLDEVLLDPSREVQRLWGAAGAVPDISFVDSKGQIVQRINGWEKRDPAITRMVLSKISGEKIPMLLNPKGYTGSEVCGICHELEYESWQYTQHAGAFDTLIKHGEERNAECVSCHVVGFDEPGGYTIADAPAHLENVSCENCHGRGGPHLSKDFVTAGSYSTVCETCHNPTHSLGFDYATFRPVVSHTAIAALGPAERASLRRSRPGNLLPTSADYVGSARCESCHPSEFATWSESPHARAVETLAEADASTRVECLKCHTTGFGLPGGFESASEASAHPDLARVGCESCHGPAGAHVEPDAKRIGTILSLGDKCDSCVILQICGGCHDDANDPGFEFEVEEKIERQRHGTIQPGTGQPIEEAAARSALDLVHGLAHAEANEARQR